MGTIQDETVVQSLAVTTETTLDTLEEISPEAVAVLIAIGKPFILKLEAFLAKSGTANLATAESTARAASEAVARVQFGKLG